LNEKLNEESLRSVSEYLSESSNKRYNENHGESVSHSVLDLLLRDLMRNNLENVSGGSWEMLLIFWQKTSWEIMKDVSLRVFLNLWIRMRNVWESAPGSFLHLWTRDLMRNLKSLRNFIWELLGGTLDFLIIEDRKSLGKCLWELLGDTL